ncbi:unnamed protein product [Nezara viridula]|uniref:Solute carrier family 66 member 3 n=1 Tax=Nezara viridula TaxID=85310 RepID=A0A9P0E0X6_NEZVI|nr:unnamed protein product [Nezara viridula]
MDFTQIISDSFSLIIISMCLFLKIPQIRSIISLKNARGINIYGLIMELGSYTTTALYNYVNKYSPLSYMEYPVLIAQEYVLIYLVLYYQNLIGIKVVITTILYFGLAISFLLKVLDPSILTLIVPFCTPVSLSSKAIQLWEIKRKQNADSVSVTTWVISALTNGSRIYTILMDSKDILLLTNFTLSTVMSGTIALTAYIMQHKKKQS